MRWVRGPKVPAWGAAVQRRVPVRRIDVLQSTFDSTVLPRAPEAPRDTDLVMVNSVPNKRNSDQCTHT